MTDTPQAWVIDTHTETLADGTPVLSTAIALPYDIDPITRRIIMKVGVHQPDLLSKLDWDMIDEAVKAGEPKAVQFPKQDDGAGRVSSFRSPIIGP